MGKTKVLYTEVINQSNVRNLKYFCVKVPHSMNFNLLYGTSKRSNVPYEFDIRIKFELKFARFITICDLEFSHLIYLVITYHFIIFSRNSRPDN